ncbi:FAD/NAD-P-binding domain-containing protein [Gymnopus androsaceus JB14]|uniref:FAD/NAD-P-binding domain-containing protein n=1 Tax=Gymnopus androsaceus JB14 TaxID=1447944 RepID=A0A6A4IH26_9AGAR|nr:FAD/NAD-P-binding domain-containing protein [Gymnopus androsaceus JB14]
MAIMQTLPTMDTNYRNFCNDEPRPMKIVVVGAGYGGIIAGIRFLQRVKNIDLTIYEANEGVGGAWFVNRYPGLSCDIPSHCYQLTFAENPNWSSFYSPGPEIQSYLESVVDKFHLDPYIKLQHRMTKAQYNEDTGKWHLTIRRPTGNNSNGVSEAEGQKPGLLDDFEDIEDTADVLFTALGALSRWEWPDIEGLETFEGKVIHSADWKTGEGDTGPKTKWEDTVKSWGEKKVGVIGVGSSAIQIVPALQPKVAQIVNFVRGQTWVSTTFVREHLVALANGDETVENYKFTDEDKQKFSNPEYYKNFRKAIESDMNGAHSATIRGHPLQQGARKIFGEIMRVKLAKKPWIADHLIPEFSVACRRLTPGPGYLEALCEDNVEFVPENIKRITPKGIETVDGKHRELDVIVCATGFETSGKLPFPFIGRGGVDLKDKFDPHPRTYLAIAVDGFPNWFSALGPNSGVGAGSLLLLIEKQVDYAVAATLKLQRERIKSIEVKKKAVDDFDAYLESVFGEKCRSWYKAGKEEGRVVALWPGSCLHCARALEHPRWEDYDYEPLDPVNNRFFWLGDGNTIADKVPGSDRAWYLDPEEVDIPQLQ